MCLSHPIHTAAMPFLTQVSLSTRCKQCERSGWHRCVSCGSAWYSHSFGMFPDSATPWSALAPRSVLLVPCASLSPSSQIQSETNGTFHAHSTEERFPALLLVTFMDPGRNCICTRHNLSSIDLASDVGSVIFVAYMVGLCNVILFTE